MRSLKIELTLEELQVLEQWVKFWFESPEPDTASEQEYQHMASIQNKLMVAKSEV